MHMYMTVIYLYHMLLQGKLSHRDEGKEDQTIPACKATLGTYSLYICNYGRILAGVSACVVQFLWIA